MIWIPCEKQPFTEDAECTPLAQLFLFFHLATVKGRRESAGPTVIPGRKADAVKSDLALKEADKPMKGVVLAGGTGSRLHPLTKVTNKHLLPVYDKPMIYYPIQTLVNAGIRDILLVTGGNSAGDFLRLLGNGKEFGLQHLNYTYQEGEGGIAAALSLAEYFADG